MAGIKLTPKAQRYLRWAEQRGERGFPVVGVPDQATVEALVGKGLVRFEPDPYTQAPSFRGTIYAVGA